MLGGGSTLAVLYVLAPYGLLASASFGAARLLAALVIMLAVHRHRPFRPAAWMMLASGVALTAIGDAVWFWLEMRGLEPFPSVADAFYLSAYILFAMTLWELGRRGDGDYSLLTDVLIVGVSAAVLGWVFLIAPSLNDPTITVSGRVISIAYPVADLILLTMILRLVFMHGASIGAHLLILLGAVSYLGAHVVYALANLAGMFAPGGLIDGLWLIAYSLFAAAVWHPSASVEPAARAPNAPLSPRRLIAVAAAAVFVPAVMLIHVGTDVTVARITAIASILLFLLVMHRVAGMMKEARRQASLLEELTRIDPLTGAANRRHLEHELARERSRAERTRAPLSVAFLDVDRFKAFNDRYGHPAGDDLLQDLVAAWGEILRPVDVLARFGGEEFVVLFPGSDSDACEAAVERLRGLVPNGQTCSAGVATLLPDETAGALIERADRALYAAKHGGRDRTVVAEHGSPIDRRVASVTQDPATATPAHRLAAAGRPSGRGS